VTHDLDLLSPVADMVVFLHNGCVAFFGTLPRLFNPQILLSRSFWNPTVQLSGQSSRTVSRFTVAFQRTLNSRAS
jgi:ABC-type transporter Mla maintaining outer membrane lipid asymmetry ATPase subunit MlaF